ncbi:hypothetical protein FA10DRAFT_121145 [Acaromyces ingoldii]|uniref:Ricin B lectin domain-containing protein n=1 Tax=Acaromyces ingoldii TaxID=215250 RepID=A0A316YN93_9BASI|nr:hypothetical protein FA10DRAFT_121145 [Acaromyces ingoldii]PWN90681.1 hypothetical protein FA10DRAFT_121145 [Acaromyces ingoldii]
MRNLAIFLELFCIVSLSVSAASIDKRIVPPLKCDSNPFHESTLTVIPADQHSDQQYDKHSENMIVPTVPLNSRDLLNDYRNGEAWNHYLYKRSELDVSQERDFGVGVQDNRLVPYAYKDHGANPTFKFYTCHSDMMGYSKEDDGQGNKVVYGHLKPSDQADRCITAATLLRRNERYKVENCEHSDDSGQFLQWWRLDINVKRYEDGTVSKL